MATTTVRVPARDRRLQIMQAAKELFARQGFEGTTTREIAQRVRVNEAIIFRHFPTKEGLYWSIIDTQSKALAWKENLERQLNSGEDDEKIFAAIAEAIVVSRAKNTDLSRLFLFSALENQRRSQT